MALMKTLTAISVLCMLYIFSAKWHAIFLMADAMDKQLMILLNFKGGAFVDRFLHGYSQKIVWAPLVAVALATIFANQQGPVRRKLLVVLAVVLMVVVLDQLSSSVIKPLACRLRPLPHPHSQRNAPLCQRLSWRPLRVRFRPCHQHRWYCRVLGHDVPRPLHSLVVGSLCPAHVLFTHLFRRTLSR